MSETALISAQSSNTNVIYSSQWDSSTYAAYKAFDNSLNTFWSSSSNNVTNQYIGYHFSQAVIANKIGFVPREKNNAITMRNYKVQASNDNSTWVDLYTGSVANNISLSRTWVYAEFNNETAYSYYRLFIADLYGSNPAITLYEMQLYYVEAPPPPPPAGIPIIIQRNNSEKNRVNKDITDVLTLYGTLKTDTSIIDPVIMFECDLLDVVDCNYITIEAFNRSYFITNIRSLRMGLVEISAHVDVLSSYSSQLKELKAITRRQENRWNLYLNDGVFKVYQNPIVLTRAFPSGFSTMEFVLAVAGA